MNPIPIPRSYPAALHPDAYSSVLGAPVTGSLVDDDVRPLEVVWFPGRMHAEDVVQVRSLWLPTEAERTRLAITGVIALTLTFPAHPPVSLEVEDLSAHH